MNVSQNPGSSRRAFLENTGRVVAASALTGVDLPAVHAGESHTIQLALVGCGGRGTGAAANALSTKSGPIKLVAMADVFEHRLKMSYEALTSTGGDASSGSVDRPVGGWDPAQVDVPPDRRFLGFDAYKKAIACLKPGDVVLLTTPCAFRWVHFGHAIDKGVNVFMEKPTTVDGPSTRRMLELADRSAKKNLKVGVGLMCRHCEARKELLKRLRDGQIGEILSLKTYRLVGPAGFTGPKPPELSELLYQVQKYLSFFWASGGLVHDYTSHNIDECCWMKGSWPVRAQGSAGRFYRGDDVDQNLDHYSVEYTFRRWHEPVHERPQYLGVPWRIRQLRPRDPGFGGHLHQHAHTGQVPDLQGAQSYQGRSGLGVSPAGAQSVSTRMGPSDQRDPPGPAAQRGQARC